MEPVRFAVAGLGHIANKAVLPAFARTPSATLVNVISSKPHPTLPTFSYDQYEEALRQVEAVYLALPNHLHHDYANRAARLGIHVLTEKPLAVTSAEAEDMIAVAKQHGTLLMPAYRHQFGAAHREALAAVHSGKLGDVRSFHSVFTLQVKPDNIRIRRATGGGTLPDIGIYCINAARHVFQSEPVEVFGLTAARPDDRRFAEVEEMFSATLRFPNERLATFTCSFGSTRVMTYDIVGTTGALHLDPVYDYTSDIRYTETIEGVRQDRIFPRQDQFALEIEHFANCIRTGQQPLATPADAVADLRVIESLYAASTR